MTDVARQVLCGPFSEKDLPDYQAAKLHAEGHWFECLPRSAYAFLSSLINRTARFHKARCKASKAYLFNGHAQTDERGYAGQNPIIEMHADSFKKMKRMLKDYGILRSFGRFDDEYEINYSVTIADLVKLPDVRARIRKNHTHGQLSTDEGIYQWATTIQSRYLSRQRLQKSQESNSTTEQPSKRLSITKWQGKMPQAANVGTKPKSMPAQTQTQNTGETMQQEKSSNSSPQKRISSIRMQPSIIQGFKALIRGGLMRPYTTTHVFLPISNETERNMQARDLSMGNKAANDVLASVTSLVNKRRDKLTEKRKTRRTVSDMVSLFESNWSKGQRDAGASLPARIVGKDRALIKSQLLKRVQDGSFDTDAFAYWVSHHWQAIGAQYFSKVKSYPELPNVPWFIKCMETYLTAFAQREFLDEAGTRSHTDIMRSAKRANTEVQKTDALLQSIASELSEERQARRDFAKENAELRKQLRELNKDGGISLARKTKQRSNSDDDDDLDNLRKQFKVIDTTKLPDYDDYDEDGNYIGKPKLRIKRKRK